MGSRKALQQPEMQHELVLRQNTAGLLWECWGVREGLTVGTELPAEVAVALASQSWACSARKGRTSAWGPLGRRPGCCRKRS